jgi:hypothetical protein
MEEPYEEEECPHTRRFEVNGVWVCMDCAAEYDEKLFEWVQKQ